MYSQANTLTCSPIFTKANEKRDSTEFFKNQRPLAEDIAALPQYGRVAQSEWAINQAREKRNRYRYNRASYFESYNRPWNDSGAASKNVIGKCMEIAQNAMNAGATTYAAFYTYYMERKHEALLRAAQMFASYEDANGNIVGNHLSPKEAWAHTVIHAIDQTWEGMEREIRVREAVEAWLTQQPGCEAVSVRYSAWEVDQGYKVDLELMDGERVLYGLQVKPSNFYNSTRPTLKERWGFARAHEAYGEEFGAPAGFCSIEPAINHGIEDTSTNLLVFRSSVVDEDTGAVSYTAEIDPDLLLARM